MWKLWTFQKGLLTSKRVLQEKGYYTQWTLFFDLISSIWLAVILHFVVVYFRYRIACLFANAPYLFTVLCSVLLAKSGSWVRCTAGTMVRCRARQPPHDFPAASPSSSRATWRSWARAKTLTPGWRTSWPRWPGDSATRPASRPWSRPCRRRRCAPAWASSRGSSSTGGPGCRRPGTRATRWPWRTFRASSGRWRPGWRSLRPCSSPSRWVVDQFLIEFCCTSKYSHRRFLDSA